MKTGICFAIAGVALFALAENASAEELTKLSDAQMDGVTAAGIAIAEAAALTAGDLLSESLATTETIVDNSILATAAAGSTGLAASVVFPAVSESGSAAAASLP
jgi:hypothetical protein